MRILFLAGSPRANARSRRLVDHALEHARDAHAQHELDVLDLHEEPPEPFRGFGETYPQETWDLVDRLVRADVLIIAAPVYNGAYPAALKNLFEFVDYKVLEGRVAGLIVSAGGPTAFLQVRDQVESLMAYFRIRTIPRAVFTTREQVDEGVPDDVLDRIEQLVDDALRTRQALLDAGVVDHAPASEVAAAAER